MTSSQSASDLRNSPARKYRVARFVPALGEIGLELDDARERHDTLLQVAGVHLLDTRLVEPVHFRIAGACPDTPECLLGVIARVLVGIAQRVYQQRHVGHRADFTQATGGVTTRRRVGVGERLNGLRMGIEFAKIWLMTARPER